MAERQTPDPDRPGFVPVCSIGASAGGVGVLQDLFRLLPDDLGLAYVVIVHLAPDHPSAMDQILGACTRMPVFQVLDGPTLKANCVYVIPPDRELVIDGDSVTARPFTDPRGQRAPIDMFFRSVAAGRGDGIAVVLTGAGSDGAVGVRAIKEAGGIVMVQEPAEASFPSMPQNAIATGVADVVAPTARLAERIAEAARSKEAIRSLDGDGAANDLRRIIVFLRTRTGHDFSGYKRATVMRRVMRRMQVAQITSLEDYDRHLRGAPDEAQALFADLLISVTMFFRDPATFEALARHVIRPLVEKASEGDDPGELRAWVVGCATGEEAYSLAILILEEAEQLKVRVPIQIFATDLDEGALVTAREGRYPRSIAADVSAERLKRFFVDEGTHYRINRQVRDLVLFATHSVLREPPFVRLDLITCRNVLIYLERALQRHVCDVFHYGLKPDRFLFLGTAETTEPVQGQFAAVDRDARIYRSRVKETSTLPVLAPMPALGSSTPFRTLDRITPSRFDGAEMPGAAHAAALEASAPPSAIVDADHDVLHLSPTAGRFILLSAGPLSGKLPSMVRPELRLDLRLALVRAFDTQQPSATRFLDVRFDTEIRRVSAHVVPMPRREGSAERAMVYFHDNGPGQAADGTQDVSLSDDVRHLHSELKAAQEAAIAERLRHEIAQQELRASNEELQSLNEEYRSTAEELETSKEELQSLNEELHTVNAELKSKLSTLSAAHDDLRNLTTSSEIGTLFLDRGLRIRMFTPPVTELVNVIEADVGRRITDLTHQLVDDGIERDVHQVLRSLEPIEREARDRRDRWFAMRVRPYRTLDDRIEGTVVTFDDITDRKRGEIALRQTEERRAFLLELSDALRPLSNPVDVEGEACRLLGERLGVDRTYYVSIDEPRGTARVERDYVRGPSGSIAGEHPVSSFSWSVDILRRGDCHIVENTQTSSVVPEDQRAALAALDIAACMGTPLIKDGVLVGALCATSSRSRAWQDAEIDLLCEVGERVWAAIERARAETALGESEQRLALAFRTLPVGIAILDVAGDIVTANDEMRRFLPTGKIPSRDPSGASRWRGWDIDGRIVQSEAFPGARALRGERVFPGMQMLYRDDGDVEIWTEVSSTPLPDGEGRISGAISVVVDVDRVKRSEERAQASEERLRQFGEASHDILWIRDADTLQWTYLTPAFEAIYGLSCEEALTGDNYRGWQDLIVPEDRAYAVASIDRVRAGEHVTFEYRIRRPSDGELRWLRNTDFPMRDETGRVVRIGGVGHDITALKAIETALTHSEGRLRALVEGVSQLVWRAIDGGDWIWASPQWTAYTGQAEADSHHRGWLDPVHPDDRPAALAAWEHVGDTGFEVEYRIRNAATGTYRWFQTRAAPRRDTRGEVVEWLGTSTDIHDLKALQESQAVMVAELQHRTRNLIAVVRGIADDTMEQTGATEAFRLALGDRLSALSRVQGLLSRAEVEPITLAAVVRLELDALGADTASERVTVAGPDVWLRNSTVQTLALALHELATNARKYGALSHDRGRLAVTWSERADAGERRLVIEWVETGLEHAPVRKQPASEGGGYGRELIEEALPHALGARTSYTLTETGVRCTIDLPSRPDLHDGGRS